MSEKLKKKLISAVQYIMFTAMALVCMLAEWSMINALIDRMWLYAAECWVISMLTGAAAIPMGNENFLIFEDEE